MKQIGYLAVASALVLAGCVGTFASEAPVSESGSGDSSGSEPSPGNLTMEIVDLEAKWVPPARIEVTATVNGTLTEDGEPVEREFVRGVGTLLSSPWVCLGCQRIERREGNFKVLTPSDGTYSTSGGSPHYFSPYPPPVGEPYCTGVGFYVWGVAGRNDTVPYAQDRIEWEEICTQSYP